MTEQQLHQMQSEQYYQAQMGDDPIYEGEEQMQQYQYGEEMEGMEEMQEMMDEEEYMRRMEQL